MKIMLVGNTGYVSESFIREAFPGHKVTVADHAGLAADPAKQIASVSLPQNEQMRTELLGTTDWDLIIYFSNMLTFGGTWEGDMDQLDRILHPYCSCQGARVICLMPRRENLTGGDAAVFEKSAETLCRYYSDTTKAIIKILHIPCLYSASYEDDFFFTAFRNIEEKEKIQIPGARQEGASFLCMDDLALLMYRMIDGWEDVNETLSVPDCFGLTREDLARELQDLNRGVQVSFSSEEGVRQTTQDDHVLRSRYGWFPQIPLRDDLPGMYEEYRRSRRKRGTGRRRLQGLRAVLGRFLIVAELLVGGLLIEILNDLSGSSIQFQMVDFRLAFIMIMATGYGTGTGLAAAALESLSLVWAYYENGTNWDTLFYEPTNWIPFIVYFLVGAVCGYIRMRSREDMEFINQKYDVLQEKYTFLRGIYHEALQDKDGYKQQIMGSQDSFGKIFNVTRRLDVVHPDEIFVQAIQVIEEVMDNKTVSLYSIGQNKSFARLEAASRGILGVSPKSIRMEDYGKALEKLNQDEIWVNTELLEGYPMYIAGIRRDGQLLILIFLKEARYSQLNLYYENLLKILSGLVETFLVRALEHQRMSAQENFLEGTRIMNSRSFQEHLQIHRSMKEQKIASYLLLRLDRGSMNLYEANEAMKGKFRENDALGLSEDGDLLLMLAQTDEEFLPPILKRLEQAGFQAMDITKEDGQTEPVMSKEIEV